MFNSVKPRSLGAAAILSGWILGIVAFTKREIERGSGDRLAEIALRVAPASHYYAIERHGRAVGFASTSIDTLARAFQLIDYRVTEDAASRQPRRATEQLRARLSRGLALRDFSFAVADSERTRRVSGWRLSDTTLAYVVTQPGQPADTQRLSVAADAVLPSMVPMLVALGGGLDVGANQRFAVFDPSDGSQRTSTVRVIAESLFVVPDSAVYDGSRARWTIARSDSVRGWRLGIDGDDLWVDERGQIVARYTSDSLSLRRTAYELAFENWRAERPRETPDAPRARGNVDLALDRPVRPFDGDSITIRLTGISLAMLDLAGAWQDVTDDRVRVRRVPATAMVPGFALPPGEQIRLRFASSTGSAPMIDVDDPAIVKRSAELAAREADPVRVTRRIVEWMRDSVSHGPGDDNLGASRTLRVRRGSAAAQSMLFVALARASGVPSRPVRGLLIDDGRVHTHTWAEVFLQGWIPVDPFLREFPASPAHVRLLVDDVDATEEFNRAVASLRVDILSSRR
ncbi:MAG: hypothetical protein MNPFHGCM_01238 [Gemmatimonadaceae bacterium]|nr:hypothetical protein [Gemmatimonadaceae bacterium]